MVQLPKSGHGHLVTAGLPYALSSLWQFCAWYVLARWIGLFLTTRVNAQDRWARGDIDTSTWSHYAWATHLILFVPSTAVTCWMIWRGRTTALRWLLWSTMATGTGIGLVLWATNVAGLRDYLID